MKNSIGRLNSEILNSWKEIASYLGRGVRTAQRWERELRLPVRRPRGRRRSAVIAVRKEIDAWLSSCPQMGFDRAKPSDVGIRNRHDVQETWVQ
jgi:predicted DNA-binding transcriptional regulator AlpA